MGRAIIPGGASILAPRRSPPMIRMGSELFFLLVAGGRRGHELLPALLRPPLVPVVLREVVVLVRDALQGRERLLRVVVERLLARRDRPRGDRRGGVEVPEDPGGADRTAAAPDDRLVLVDDRADAAEV